jgi:hypothetical protein
LRPPPEPSVHEPAYCTMGTDKARRDESVLRCRRRTDALRRTTASIQEGAPANGHGIDRPRR